MKREHDDTWEESDAKVQLLDNEEILAPLLPEICWYAYNWIQARYLLGTVCKSWNKIMDEYSFPFERFTSPLIETLISTLTTKVWWMRWKGRQTANMTLQIAIALKKMETENVFPILYIENISHLKKLYKVFAHLNLPVCLIQYTTTQTYEKIYRLFGDEKNPWKMKSLPHFGFPDLHFIVKTIPCLNDELYDPEFVSKWLRNFDLRPNTKYYITRSRHPERGRQYREARSLPIEKRYQWWKLDNTTKRRVYVNDVLCSTCRQDVLHFSSFLTPFTTQPKISIEIYNTHQSNYLKLLNFVYRQNALTMWTTENTEWTKISEYYSSERPGDLRHEIQGNELHLWLNQK
jgi:hypothetical protein